VLSTLGPIEITRAYAINSENKRYFPLDDALGITGGMTPAAAGLLCWAGAELGSYDLAERTLKQLAALDVPGRRVQRVVNFQADSINTWVSSREEKIEKGGFLNLQVDMTGIPMRKEDLVGVKGKNGDPKKKQIKAGAVFKQETNANGEIQRVPCSTSHVVSFDDVTNFSRNFLNEAVIRGYHQADKIILTADGAEWIWLMAQDRFKGAVEIVDFYHAAEHLKTLCFLAEPEPEKAQMLFKLRRKYMCTYGANCIIRYFQNLSPEHPAKAEIEAGLHYFTNNLKRMDYGAFRKAGYFIGSGVIEGTCKSLINQRTDLSGQRWHVSGSLNVLRCRALITDGLHERYWQSRAKLYKPKAEKRIA